MSALRQQRPFGEVSFLTLTEHLFFRNLFYRCWGPQERPRRPGAAGLLLAFPARASQPSDSVGRSGGSHFGRSLHAARAARRVLNVPFQSSIRAWMLLQAARKARSFLCGESAT